jgi:hypothetical protein
MKPQLLRASSQLQDKFLNQASQPSPLDFPSEMQLEIFKVSPVVYLFSLVLHVDVWTLFIEPCGLFPSRSSISVLMPLPESIRNVLNSTKASDWALD